MKFQMMVYKMDKGIIVKNISNKYDVLKDDVVYTCEVCGKIKYNKVQALVGDIVEFSPDDLIIKEILPRKNSLPRPHVANIDILLIVTSIKEPDMSLYMLDKELVLALQNKIRPMICFTKSDLLTQEEKNNFNKIYEYYEAAGYEVLMNTNLSLIKKMLKNKLVALTGQTGAGKSSLLNSLDNKLNISTNPISKALGRGIHTTRDTQIYKIDNISFIDTPGFSSLDILGIEPQELTKYFLEFGGIECEFKDCTHEGNCALVKNVFNGVIMKSRYDNYLRLLKECYESRSQLYKK